MGNESIIIGTVDRGEPMTEVSKEWEILDLEWVIVSVDREQSQAKERSIDAVRGEEMSED